MSRGRTAKLADNNIKMKKICLGVWGLVLLLGFGFSGLAAFGAEDELIKIGGKEGWGAISVKKGVVELKQIRPTPVLSLSALSDKKDKMLDLELKFDEKYRKSFVDTMQNYEVSRGNNLEYVSGALSRYGDGAALFYDIPRNSSNLLAHYEQFEDLTRIIPRNGSALFSENHSIDNFSIEFTLFPNNMNNGEEIILWQSEKTMNSAGASTKKSRQGLQYFNCTTDKNKILWNFDNFFISPDGTKSIPVRISSQTALTPKTWSTHLLRYNGSTGLLEYFVNGSPEAVVYVNSTGREGGEVYNPVTGSNGFFILGRDYTGILDEFKIIGAYKEEPEENIRFLRTKSRIESAPLDTGSYESELKKVEVSGGNLKFSGLKFDNSYEKDGSLHFPDNSQVQLFVRASQSEFTLNSVKWIPIENNSELIPVKGRYVQVAADFYPGENLDSAPYIEEIKIKYNSKDLPLPPDNFRVQSGDGFVTLSWKERKFESPAGYLIYYGTKKGEYFGEDALLGPSPIDVGNVSSVRLDNLKNGTLYYFTVAAYNDVSRIEPGVSSRELSARPLGTFE